MLRFSILPRAVVALAAIRSTDTTRPVLNGVHLAPDGTMTATDGHCLLTWRNAAEFDDTDGPASGLLGVGYVLEITPALLKLARAKKCERLALEIEDNNVARWIMVKSVNGYRDADGATLARVLDGPFPAYRNVIPREVPEVAGALPPINAKYVGRFALVDPTLNAGVTLTPTGSSSPVCVTFQNNLDAFGLVMPLVDKDMPRTVPAWVHPTAHECTACRRAFTEAPSDQGYCPECARPFAPSPDCPAAEHDDTNAECICAYAAVA